MALFAPVMAQRGAWPGVIRKSDPQSSRAGDAGRRVFRRTRRFRPALACGNISAVSARRFVPPVLRQLRSDRLGLASAAQSEHSRALTARTATADRVVQSICPYCAVGCGQKVYVSDERVTQIEGDPASPISRGRLCPKGAASEKLVNGPLRKYRVKYRRPHAREWESLDLETAMDMIADRIVANREATWEATNEEGQPLNRTLGWGILGGATLDTEENYLIKKCFTAAGAVSIENQARI
jgi:formate dehydrogenase major subunit